MEAVAVKTAIRTRVLGIEAVRDLIGARFYQAHLATITDPVYPCANFVLGPGDLEENLGKIANWSMRLWCWSSVSIDHAQNVCKEIQGALHRVPIRQPNLNIVCTLDGLPVEMFEPIEKLHYVITPWGVRAFES